MAYSDPVEAERAEREEGDGRQLHGKPLPAREPEDEGADGRDQTRYRAASCGAGCRRGDRRDGRRRCAPPSPRGDTAVKSDADPAVETPEARAAGTMKVRIAVSAQTSRKPIVSRRRIPGARSTAPTLMCPTSTSCSGARLGDGRARRHGGDRRQDRHSRAGELDPAERREHGQQEGGDEATCGDRHLPHAERGAAATGGEAVEDGDRSPPPDQRGGDAREQEADAERDDARRVAADASSTPVAMPPISNGRRGPKRSTATPAPDERDRVPDAVAEISVPRPAADSPYVCASSGASAPRPHCTIEIEVWHATARPEQACRRRAYGSSPSVRGSSPSVRAAA